MGGQQAEETADNAVAPDWNLKLNFRNSMMLNYKNAVAPDWNLKVLNAVRLTSGKINAVAPDWNLKVFNVEQRSHFIKMQSHQIGI